jgi:hypothetical protein
MKKHLYGQPRFAPVSWFDSRRRPWRRRNFHPASLLRLRRFLPKRLQ